jgi:HD-GYP domain-containing protein (c-di-GMP phosphodiesterase class II)
LKYEVEYYRLHEYDREIQMNTKEISIVKLFRKRIIINISLIGVIILSFGVMLFNISNFDYENRVLINILGNQRALTQSMAKNASRVYMLLEIVQDRRNAPSEEDLASRISKCQQELQKDKETFETVLSQIHKGYIINEKKHIKFTNSLEELARPLNNIEEIWPQFSKAVDTIVQATEFNSQLIYATRFINETNDELLKNSNLMTVTILDTAKNSAFINIAVSAVLVILSLITIALLLVRLYKYILIPIDELNKEVAKLGIIDNSSEVSPAFSSKEIAPVVSEINIVFQKLNKLISLIENINQNSSFNEILQYIYHSFSSFIPYTYIGIAMITDEGDNIKAAYGFSSQKLKGLPYDLLGKKTSLKETSLGRVIETGEPRIINDLEKYAASKDMKYYNKVILDAGIRSSITLPLKFNNKPIGIIFFSSKLKNIYKDEHVKFLQTITNSISIAFQKNIFIEELLYSSILALAKLAESRDEDTGDHLYRMKIYSRVIAQFLYEDSKYKDYINIEYIENIERFSPLHDIGKVGIRDKILLKPGKLTTEEFEEMKHHAVYGAEVLRAADENMSKNGKSLFKLGIEIAEAHHEKWDGAGYPKGKKGEEIPLSARIVAVADVFDALTSKRPYKEPFTIEQAYEILIEGSGKHFDPEIIRVFVKNKDSIVKLYNDFSASRSA